MEASLSKAGLRPPRSWWWDVAIVLFTFFLSQTWTRYVHGEAERKLVGASLSVVYEDLWLSDSSTVAAERLWNQTLYAAEHLLDAGGRGGRAHPDSIRVWLSKVSYADLPRVNVEAARSILEVTPFTLPANVRFDVLRAISEAGENEEFGVKAYRSFVDQVIGLGTVVPKPDRLAWEPIGARVGAPSGAAVGRASDYYETPGRRRPPIGGPLSDWDVQAIVRSPEARRWLAELHNQGSDVRYWCRAHVEALAPALRSLARELDDRGKDRKLLRHEQAPVEPPTHA